MATKKQIEKFAKEVGLSRKSAESDAALTARTLKAVGKLDDKKWGDLSNKIKIWSNEENQKIKDAEAKKAAPKKAAAKKAAPKKAAAKASPTANQAIEALDYAAFKKAIKELNDSGILPQKVNPINKKPVVIGNFMYALEQLDEGQLAEVPEAPASFYITLTGAGVKSVAPKKAAPKKAAAKKTAKKGSASDAELEAAKEAAATVVETTKVKRDQSLPALEDVLDTKQPYNAGLLGHLMCCVISEGKSAKTKTTGMLFSDVVAEMEKRLDGTTLGAKYQSIGKRCRLLLRLCCQEGRSKHNGLVKKIKTAKMTEPGYKYTGKKLAIWEDWMFTGEAPTE